MLISRATAPKVSFSSHGFSNHISTTAKISRTTVPVVPLFIKIMLWLHFHSLKIHSFDFLSLLEFHIKRLSLASPPSIHQQKVSIVSKRRSTFIISRIYDDRLLKFRIFFSSQPALARWQKKVFPPFSHQAWAAFLKDLFFKSIHHPHTAHIEQIAVAKGETIFVLTSDELALGAKKNTLGYWLSFNYWSLSWRK